MKNSKFTSNVYNQRSLNNKYITTDNLVTQFCYCKLLTLIHDNSEQAGVELCQAQAQVGLTAEAELILVLSSMEAVFPSFQNCFRLY